MTDNNNQGKVAREDLPPIPAKRYFTSARSANGGVSRTCCATGSRNFPRLKPVKRRGNRRYYQPSEVLLVRRIRELLYSEGFTISGARNRLDEGVGILGTTGAATRKAEQELLAIVESLR